MNQTKARELVIKAWQSCGQGGVSVRRVFMWSSQKPNAKKYITLKD